MRRSYLALLFGLLVPRYLTAQAAVLEARSGRYEVIGLSRWTLSQLQDSLGAHDASLTSHTCAGVMRSALGFPDVSVVLYPAGEAGRPTKFFEIMVLEPQDSARARFLPMPRDSFPILEAWAGLALPFRHNNNLWGFLLTNPQALFSSEPIDSLLLRSPDTEQLRVTLRALAPAHLVDTAIRVLERDRNPFNMFAALLVLSSPRSGPRGLTGLAHALRSPLSFTSLSASLLLAYRIQVEPPPIDWTPLVPDLKLVLDGTNLFALGPVMGLLQKTPPPQATGEALITGGGRMLLARLAASDSAIRHDAHALLQSLTGAVLPPDPTVWAAQLGVLWD